MFLHPTTFSNTAYYSGFGNAHNIFINEDTGFAYAVGTELAVLEVFILLIFQLHQFPQNLHVYLTLIQEEMEQDILMMFNV